MFVSFVVVVACECVVTEWIKPGLWLMAGGLQTGGDQLSLTEDGSKLIKSITLLITCESKDVWQIFEVFARLLDILITI